MTKRLPSRADHVGSLLRPPALQTARQQHADGLLSAESLRQIEDSCIREVVRMQEAGGVEIGHGWRVPSRLLALRFPGWLERRGDG